MSPLKNFLLLLMLVIFANGYSQFVPATFKRTIDSLIDKSPKTYIEIDSKIKSFRRDTLLMDYFAETAAQKGYLDGQAYALIQLGTYFRNVSQYNRALALHQRALDVATESDNLEFKVSSLNQLGVDYRENIEYTHGHGL